MSRFQLPSGQVVQIDTPFTIEQVTVIPAVYDEEGVEVSPESEATDQIQHPSGVRGLSVADRTALGIVEVVEQARPDDRYGFVTESSTTPGAWDYTPFPAETLAPLLLEYAKNKRWGKEVGGINFYGIPIATDDRSKQMIMGARIAASADPDFEAAWDAGGMPVTLNATQLVAISNAVSTHVNSCFSIYGVVAAQIAAEEITTFEAIDTAFA